MLTFLLENELSSHIHGLPAVMQQTTAAGAILQPHKILRTPYECMPKMQGNDKTQQKASVEIQVLDLMHNLSAGARKVIRVTMEPWRVIKASQGEASMHLTELALHSLA